MNSRLAKLRHVAFDLDGTLYLGGRLFAHSRPLLDKLGCLGIGHTFLTNNCARSRVQYARHLQKIGIDATRDLIRTSADATIRHLQTWLPGITTLLVLGTEGLCDDLALADYQIADMSAGADASPPPEAVVVGYDTTLTFDRLCNTAYWIGRGLPFIATHPDRYCPTDQASILPDCGAICALLESATGRKPDAIAGKPNLAMLEALFAERNLQPNEVAFVGDRLYTDIRMARAAGALAILTLTGETKRSDLDDCPASNQPDLVVEHLGELRQMLEESRVGCLRG